MWTRFLVQRLFPNTHLCDKVTRRRINKPLLKKVIAKLQTQTLFVASPFFSFCPFPSVTTVAGEHPAPPAPQPSPHPPLALLSPSPRPPLALLSPSPSDSLLIMLTSLAPSPMARVTAFLCFLMSSTTCAFCSGVTLQQITALQAHAVDTNSLSMSASRACA